MNVASKPLDDAIAERLVTAITPMTIELALEALTSMEERDKAIAAQWRRAGRAVAGRRLRHGPRRRGSVASRREGLLRTLGCQAPSQPASSDWVAKSPRLASPSPNPN